MNSLIEDLKKLCGEFAQASKNHKEHFELTQGQDKRAEAYAAMLDIVIVDLDKLINKHKNEN